jgi:hypothetical protein
MINDLKPHFFSFSLGHLLIISKPCVWKGMQSCCPSGNVNCLPPFSLYQHHKALKKFTPFSVKTELNRQTTKKLVAFPCGITATFLTLCYFVQAVLPNVGKVFKSSHRNVEEIF